MWGTLNGVCVCVCVCWEGVGAGRFFVFVCECNDSELSGTVLLVFTRTSQISLLHMPKIYMRVCVSFNHVP